jgi:hypothetical protein
MVSGWCVRTELTAADGSVARITGEFATFTDPSATELSILGRDVLNVFQVIVSWLKNKVILLATNHDYRVVQA